MSRKVNFIHFGERCQTLIIIDLLLSIHRKTLFQYALHPFNTIIQILEDNNFMDIIDTKYLKHNEQYYEHLEIDKKYGFGHDTVFIHTKYNGSKIVHDYTIEDNKIINFNFVNDMYKSKINNFIEDIHSNNFVCFICFLAETNVNNLEYERMVNTLRNKHNVKDFTIFIFTNDKINDSLIIPPEYEIIYLEEIFGNDAHKSIDERLKLYKEIHEKFKNRMLKYDYYVKDFDENDVKSRIPQMNIEYLEFLSRNGL
jgi:hypothetical protein